ncbi:hypothetical protein O6P43_017123 [Quillaja saponaria]|uniref:Uncharacterized protein n=1 Tax=Quillaja saponaria TaxID=32244 RepID=A0AAD7LPA3_QUISA|nr:hypothetical protein O6P43_017123 [Quillaja saponaria]
MASCKVPQNPHDKKTVLGAAQKSPYIGTIKDVWKQKDKAKKSGDDAQVLNLRANSIVLKNFTQRKMLIESETSPAASKDVVKDHGSKDQLIIGLQGLSDLDDSGLVML